MISRQGSYFAVSSNLNCDPSRYYKSFSFRAGKIRESFETSTFIVFPWINSSIVPWIISDNISFDGTFSARSGAISNEKSTILSIRTIYDNPDTLKFQYKVSSEANYDNLVFKLNGKEILKKSGEVAWTRMKVPVPAGINIFEWSYSKDKSVFQDLIAPG
ncbi:MAG: hypothetical protein MZV63_11080 [Marinilabiliales bacterium]|nr:hypothetical protein [Marinilabiliales bacterium]